MSARRTSGAAVIAATFSTDVGSVSEQRYQPTRYAGPAVYSIGERYFAAFATKPRHAVGREWEKHADQFFAQRAGTVLWVCDMQAGGR